MIVGIRGEFSSPWVSYVVQVIAVLILMGVMWILLMRQMQIGGTRPCLSASRGKAADVAAETDYVQGCCRCR